jgi:hypothetical protein
MFVTALTTLAKIRLASIQLLSRSMVQTSTPKKSR